ncbi:MAG: hypothetical protein IPP63_03380 [Chloracidobacterium sp.]|nr:hypothetical protein [Chloracidobacterium sp.]
MPAVVPRPRQLRSNRKQNRSQPRSLSTGVAGDCTAGIADSSAAGQAQRCKDTKTTDVKPGAEVKEIKPADSATPKK